MMHLHDRVLVGLNRLASDDPLEAGDDDVIDGVFFEQSHQGDVVQIQVALAGMESDSGNPMPLREAKRVRIGSLSDDERDPPTDDSMPSSSAWTCPPTIRTDDWPPGDQPGSYSDSTPKCWATSASRSRAISMTTA